MNVNSTQNVTTTNKQQQTQTKPTSEGNTSFKQELSDLEETKAVSSKEEVKDVQEVQEVQDVQEETPEESDLTVKDISVENAMNGLEKTVQEINTSKIPQADDKTDLELKLEGFITDRTNNTEVNNLINNEINIPESLIPHMEANMNFNSNGQPFSDFMNEQGNNKLSVSEKDLQEERAILSTMEENIAMVNKAQIAVQNTEKAIIEPFNNIIMNKADVDFFVDLVKNNEIDMSTVKNPEKVTQISKTLADLLAKAMNENKPVRIDFDNDISVIIRISKDRKISADFLPSSQVAEAYLKENLPLLKQRFDENNIEYNELNQRKQQKQNEKDNRKKGRENE